MLNKKAYGLTVLQNSSKATGPFVQGRKTVLSEWEELDGSFVSNHPGGAGAQAKL